MCMPNSLLHLSVACGSLSGKWPSRWWMWVGCAVTMDAEDTAGQRLVLEVYVKTWPGSDNVVK